MVPWAGRRPANGHHGVGVGRERSVCGGGGGGRAAEAHRVGGERGADDGVAFGGIAAAGSGSGAVGGGQPEADDRTAADLGRGEGEGVSILYDKSPSVGGGECCSLVALHDPAFNDNRKSYMVAFEIEVFRCVHRQSSMLLCPSLVKSWLSRWIPIQYPSCCKQWSDLLLIECFLKI
jgi:hypothetical protein